MANCGNGLSRSVFEAATEEVEHQLGLSTALPSNFRDEEEDFTKGDQSGEEDHDQLNLDDIGPMPTPSDFVIDLPSENIIPGNCQIRESKKFILMDWEASSWIQHPADSTLTSNTLNKFHPLHIYFFQDYQETFWHPLPSLKFQFGEDIVKKKDIPVFCNQEKVEQYPLNMYVKIDYPD